MSCLELEITWEGVINIVTDLILLFVYRYCNNWLMKGKRDSAIEIDEIAMCLASKNII